MKKLLLLLFILLPVYARAQVDSIKHEIGFSTNIILYNIFSSSSSGTPVQLMYKHLAGRNRIRAGIDISQSKDKKETGLGYMHEQTTKYLAVSPSIGYEVRSKLRGRWNCNWGSDLVYDYYYRSDTLYRTSPDRQFNENYKTINQSHTIKLRPFLGVMFNISPRFLVSTEASLSASYSFKREESNRMMRDYNQHSEPVYFRHKQIYNTKSSGINLAPASAIFIYYRF